MQISRELLGKIVDEVFDGGIEDASVIEDIYRVIKREEAAAHDTVQGEAEPVAWQYEWNQYGNWVKRVGFSCMNEDDDVRNVRPLFAASPDAAATIASLEERVAVAEMERKGEDAGKAAIAELLGIAGEIRWKWIRNAILDLKGRVAEAERVIAPFAYHYGSSDMRAAAKWMEAKDENN